MELKEYLKILKNNLKTFLAVILVFIILIPAYFIYQSQKTQALLTMDITRAGSQNSQDYQFDDFYRLQADEKFADTIVEWLKSPSVVSEIWQEAYGENNNLGLKKLSKLFSVHKLSSQLVEINFSVKNEKEAQKISKAISKIIEKNIAELNEKQERNNWFRIITRGPIVRKASFDWSIIVLVSTLSGIFFGFWIVLFKHYFK